MCTKDQGVQRRQTATIFREGKSHRLYWSEDREESTHMADSAEGGRGEIMYSASVSAHIRKKGPVMDCL